MWKSLGNIVEIVESAWDTLRPHLARTRFQPNALFRESIIYPEEACREALINAVAHRDYSLEGKSIEIVIFEDRMEVKSPGGLLSAISVEDLKQLKGTHQSRNVFTARVLRELGYMREMGEGIRRIFDSIRKFELIDPEISSDRNLFTVTLFHKSVFSPKDVQWLNGFSDFNLTKDEQRVALLGRDGHLLSTDEIIKMLEIVDTEDFRALYEQLRRKGIIYSAKRVSASRGSKRRYVPRFSIRPPQEAQQYLAELQKAILEIDSIDTFEINTERKIKQMLSTDSPYHEKPIWSLQSLGYVSRSRVPLPQLRLLWSSRQTSSEVAPKDEGWIVGRIISKTDSGYGFARTEDGEEYFLHISEFTEYIHWQDITLGSKVRFQVGERQIPGKPKPGKNVEFVD